MKSNQPSSIFLYPAIQFKKAHKFTTSCSFSGKKLIEPGFTSVMTWQALSDEESVPKLNKGDVLKIKEVKLAEKQTNPPDYLTEADLVI